jgi:hypothetical protein
MQVHKCKIFLREKYKILLEEILSNKSYLSQMSRKEDSDNMAGQEGVEERPETGEAEQGALEEQEAAGGGMGPSGVQQEAPDEMKNSVVEALECPVCLELMVDWRKPVICEIGHSICRPCNEKVEGPRDRKICPICREGRSWGPNLALVRLGDNLLQAGLLPSPGPKPEALVREEQRVAEQQRRRAELQRMEEEEGRRRMEETRRRGEEQRRVVAELQGMGFSRMQSTRAVMITANQGRVDLGRAVEWLMQNVRW